MRHITTPHDAELNAARLMRSWGYLDAKATTGGSDGGIDVRSAKALAQVKFRGSKAGRPELQRLVGAREGDTSKVLLFFDYRGYSPQAIEYANRAGIGLYGYDTSGAVHAVNPAARQYMAVTWSDKLLTALTRPSVVVFGAVIAGVIMALGLMLSVL
ncbi:restriction endonuclease [Mycolicibacterium sp. S3B2]|uniref:restriction endonuclease n=1 Tax=Mycolicibacterium sp. S3B2 TaxID=3415120 RepID=UPI003C7B8250